MSFSLSAVSPIDGRYQAQLAVLSDYFSEMALIRYRIHVEIEYFIALSEAGFFPLAEVKKKNLRLLVKQFSMNDAQKVKSIEKVTNHDVKAVEYFIKEALDALKLSKHKEWVHFGLTSQDINNTAVPLLWKDAIEKVYTPLLNELISLLQSFVKEWHRIPMLARTHGQSASPTRLGKELAVFVERLENQWKQFAPIPYAAKFGGATGNFNAHHVAFPKTDWKKFANQFVNKQLGLTRMQHTTQI
ncbi:MAG: adenylosuccinate lyase, partial [Chitinophagaceae bacterium]|nr:adenylosuccinate lyase [Chitinophagaceae bacterium]